VILLIKDLAQPRRFFTILLRPQWKSWVARGAFILVGFTASAGMWWLAEAVKYLGVFDVATPLRPFFVPAILPLGLFASIYTAFLLGQAEGRDMWQSNLLPFQLFVRSIMLASGMFYFSDCSPRFPGRCMLFLPGCSPRA
jgi:formate-dependent nitrite reductase membrane component NrfD